MAVTEWFFDNDGERQGPVSGSELKQFIERGEIQPDAMVWQPGMTDWTPARSVKGLFGTPTQSSPPPLPTDRAKENSSAVPIGDQLKAGVSVIGSSAKLAGQLTANQSEKINITDGSLPKAYAELGQYVFGNAEATPELESSYDEITAINEKLEEISEKSKNQPTASTLTETAKAVASTTGAAAQTRFLQHRLKQKFTKLGEAAFECSTEWPEQLTKPISDLRNQVTELDTQIANLKQQLFEQKKFAGNVISSAVDNNQGVLFKTGVVATSAVCCFPVGLALIWLHPTWEKATKILWTAITVSCVVFFWGINHMQESATLRTLAKADQLWDDGNRAEAIDAYKEVSSNWSHLEEQDRSRVFRRLIEFDSEHDNPESAKKLIKRARDLDIELSLTSPIAQNLLNQIKELEREQRMVERTAKAESAQAPTTASLISHGPPYSKKEFKDKIREIMEQGRVDRTTVYAVCDYDKFIQTFGEPDSDIDFIDNKRQWLYRTTDGIVSLIVIFGGDRVIVTELSSY